MTEHEWLMQKISTEIIKERLGVEPSDRNVRRLAELLHDFDAEVRGRSNTNDLHSAENVSCYGGQLTAIKTSLMIHLEA